MGEDVEDKEANPEKQERKDRERRQKERDKNFDPNKFSLATAVALGCCSFEAYNSPYKSYGLKEVSPCGTEMVFMDRDFLSSRISGVLEVHLRRAIKLPEIEDKKKKVLPNSRCKITVFPSSGFTEIYEASVDPLFRQTFFLYIRDPTSQTLEVYVESITKEEEEDNICIGKAEVKDLLSLCDGKIHDMDLDLEGEDGSNGKVELSVRYQQHSEENNLLGMIKGQAVGQMMTDDWCAGVAEEWDNFPGKATDWRFTGMPQNDTLEITVLSDDSAVDIEGGEITDGQPLDRDPWKQWTDLREAVIGRQLCSDVSPLVFLLNKRTDTEVWIYRSAEKKQIVISFRGTASPKDMLTDMALDLAAFNPPGRSSRSPDEVAEGMSEEEVENGPLGGLYKGMKALEKVPGIHLVNAIIKRKAGRTRGRSAPKGLSGWAKAQMMMLYAVEHDEMWCHKGFLQAYLAVSDVIMRVVDEVMAGIGGTSPDERQEQDGKGWLADLQASAEETAGKLKEDNKWHIFCTGHSMGGALANLCAHELAVRHYGVRSKPEVSMYSFGQPRVGNGPFAKEYDKRVPDSWRVKNADDMVTRVPSLLGYQHIGCEVTLFPHRKISISAVSSDEIREGAVMTDILPKIKSGLTGDDKELQEEFQELVKGEIKVFKAIVKGEGVNQHMEDIYHNYLNGCVNGEGDEFCKPVIAVLEDAVREAEEHLKEKKEAGKA